MGHEASGGVCLERQRQACRYQRDLLAKRGDTLIEFSLDTITAAGLDPVVMMVVTNGERFSLTPGNTDDKNPDPHIIMTLKESV